MANRVKLLAGYAECGQDPDTVASRHASTGTSLWRKQRERYISGCRSNAQAAASGAATAEPAAAPAAASVAASTSGAAAANAPVAVLVRVVPWIAFVTLGALYGVVAKRMYNRG